MLAHDRAHFNRSRGAISEQTYNRLQTAIPDTKRKNCWGRIMGWIVLGILVMLVIWAISIYNRLVELKNRFKNAFSQIDVQLKRRYDLIPNLVEAAKGYLAHERETLEKVIAARNSAMGAAQKAAAAPGDAAAMQGLAQAEGQLGGAL